MSDLRLNSNKTKALLVSRKRKPPALALRLNDCAIEQVEPYKYLGVLISSDLSWSLHINRVCSRAKQLVGFLYRHLRLADPRCICRIYQAIMLPILNYCSVVWDPYHSTYIDKLERAQHFAARVVTKQWQQPGPSLAAQLQWPALKSRRTLAKLFLCRRILMGESLIPSTAFSPHPNAIIRHANSMPLFLPRVKTDYNRGSFFVSTVPIWNKLPDPLIKITSHLAFKRSVKNLFQL